jgi:hypothetical protein
MACTMSFAHPISNKLPGNPDVVSRCDRQKCLTADYPLQLITPPLLVLLVVEDTFCPRSVNDGDLEMVKVLLSKLLLSTF